MATLKEHQAAMVDLLANGSGIPASASRLAHAMHDVLEMLNLQPGDAAWRVTTYNQMQELFARTESLGGPWNDANTPGLNDKALSKREKALKTDRPAKWPTPAEQRVKELENTVKQLKANLVHERACVAELRGFLHEAQDELKRWGSCAVIGEQAGCRREDTQVCDHDWVATLQDDFRTCSKCHREKLI